jgi:hypothetical protein
VTVEPARTASPFSIDRKIFQFGLAIPAISADARVIGAVPKTAAPFANFQLHAQFHCEISKGSNPGSAFFSLLTAEVVDAG